MKKFLSLALVAVLCLCSLAIPAVAENDVVEVLYLSSTILETPEGAFEQQLIDKFNAENPGIHVTVEGCAANDLNAKLTAMAAVNDLPAFVMGNETTMSALVDMDMVVPMEDLMDQEYIDGFVPANLDSYVIDGKHYGIPYFGGAQGIIYRKDIFEEKGLSEPTTWDEFVEVCQALTGDGSYGIALVGTKNSSGASRFQPVIHNFGCDEFYKDENGQWVTDIGSEKFTAALKAFTDLNNVYGVVPPGVVETGYPEAVALFTSGQAAMLITGSNALGAITSQVPELKGKLASMPNIPVERSVSAAAGFAFFVTAQDEAVQQAAVEFIKYFINTENSLDFAELTGRLPVRKEAMESERISNMTELSGFLKALENVWIPPTIPGYSEINDILGEAYQSVFTGQATVEEASAAAGERAQALCDEANAQ